MILDELAAFARKRVAADQAKTPLADIKAQAEAMPKGDFRFEKALAGKDCAFICEVKMQARPRASSTRYLTLKPSRAAMRTPVRTVFPA